VRARIVVACAALSVMTATIGAQSPTLPPRLGSDAIAAIERVIDSAKAAGLPTTPLFDKAAEGVLKGADGPRVVIAVRGLARELAEARNVLGSADDATLLAATASALHAGATSQDLRQIVRPATGEQPDAHSIATALVALADLVTKRVSPRSAAHAVGELLARRASDNDFATLRSEVDQDIRGGAAPDVAVTNRVRAHVQVLDAVPLDRGQVKRPPPV
jgi:hypothetical protein